MRYAVAFLLPILLVGCSLSGSPVTPDYRDIVTGALENDNHWNWGVWQFYVSADHSKIDAVPLRQIDYHFCVTKFLEGYPCYDCLTIGKPIPQGDGTLKLNVTLKHPFPDTPRYTGFDVRGVVYFPPTMEQKTKHLQGYSSFIYDESPGGQDLFPGDYYFSMPLNFSRAADGGGEVLNADGFSCYLIPGLTYCLKWPIYSYQPPKQGNEPTPQLTTVNPYKLFASDDQRRMFLVSDEITREYHLDLPPGEFCFGYAVDASWWPATNTPVTDPAVDFPPEANAEDPWSIEYEQLLPVNEENVGAGIPVFKVKVHHRGFDGGWSAWLFAWDVSDLGPSTMEPQFTSWGYEEQDDYTTIVYCGIAPNWWFLYGKDGHTIPGHHFGVLIVMKGFFSPDEGTELKEIFTAKFVDIYIEE